MSGTYEYLIRRVDGEDLDGEYASFGVSDPIDWTPADDYDHDEPTEYEICRVIPIKRRTFGLGRLCWACEGEGEIETPCPVDTDGDGDCALCARHSGVHNASCKVCGGTGEGEDSTEAVDVPLPDEVTVREAAMAGAVTILFGVDTANDVMSLYRRILEGKTPFPTGVLFTPTVIQGD